MDASLTTPTDPARQAEVEKLIREWTFSCTGIPHDEPLELMEKDLIDRITAALSARDQRILELETERDKFMEDAAHREMENHSLKKQVADLVAALEKISELRNSRWEDLDLPPVAYAAVEIADNALEPHRRHGK